VTLLIYDTLLLASFFEDSEPFTFSSCSTVGYGDLTPSNFTETCYALVVGAGGAVFTAAVVANVTSFFHDAELSENNYEHKLNCIKRFMGEWPKAALSRCSLPFFPSDILLSNR
jgi:hypothetical protein